MLAWVAALAFACAPRPACDSTEVCVFESIVSACFADLAARDAELRELKALAAKGLVCLANSNYSYLLHARDRPDCATCIEQQTCFAITADNACRPDCLRE